MSSSDIQRGGNDCGMKGKVSFHQDAADKNASDEDPSTPPPTPVDPMTSNEHGRGAAEEATARALKEVAAAARLNVIPPTPPSTPAVPARETISAESATSAEGEVPFLDEEAAEPKGGDGLSEEEVAAAAAAAEAAGGGELFSRLKVLPPLQIKERKKKSGGAGSQQPPSSSSSLSMTIALPPIRAVEPVSSLRAAMGELVQYAHFTHYRFRLEEEDGATEDVVEASNKATNVKAPPSKAPSPPNSNSPSSSKSGGKKKSRKKGGGGGGNRQGSPKGSKASSSVDDFASIPYTGAGAVVATRAALQSVRKEEEVTLDDYGDLSSVPLKSGSSFRVVLEPYDVAGVRDHVARLNALLDGNPPCVTSLADGGEEEDAENAETASDAAATTVDDATGAEAKTGAGGTAGEDEKKVEGAGGRGGGGGEVSDAERGESSKKPEEEETAAGGPNVDKAKMINDAAKKKLPTFPLNKPVKVDGTNLVDFFNLACGEADDLSSSLNEEDVVAAAATDRRGGAAPSASGAAADKENKRNRPAMRRDNKTGGSSNATKSPSSPPSSGDEAEDYTKMSTGEYVSRLDALDGACHAGWRVRFGGFHPPPPHRRVVGDLAYLEVIPPSSSRARQAEGDNIGGGSYDEDEILNNDFGGYYGSGSGVGGGDGGVIFVTATPRGFYVNNTTIVRGAHRFDPSPLSSPGDEEQHCFSHNLLDCVLKKSPKFRKCWASVLAAAKERSDMNAALAAIDSPLQSLHRLAVRSMMSTANSASQTQSQTGAHGMSSAVDSVLFRPSWLVPVSTNSASKKDAISSASSWERSHSLNKMHTYSLHRAEEELNPGNGIYAGMDLRAGAERDWNEELQSAREMPTTTLAERIDRARIIHKVLSDFHVAALLGAKAIFDGQLLPMNPNEPNPRTHVYFFNNIFYSRAVDAGVDTFKIASGDNAARKSVARDAHCMATLHRLDIAPKLFTLANVIVDYMGTRLVCQSMVPGILSGEKCHTLLYGAVANGVPLKRDDEMHKLLEESLGRGCMVATRPVPTVPQMEQDTKDHLSITESAGHGDADAVKDVACGTTTICGPIEVKGIKGSDQRTYVLDLTRLTPRDANWVPESDGGTGNWEREEKNISGDKRNPVRESLEDEEWKMAVLRPELVTALTHQKMSEWIKQNRAKEEKKQQSKLSTASADKAQSESTEDIQRAEKQEASEENSSAGDHSPDSLDVKASSDAAAGSSSLSNIVKQLDKDAENYMNTLRYNVNVFLPQIKEDGKLSVDEMPDQIRKDEERAREAATYLWNTVLPTLTKEIRESSGQQVPVDGNTLTDMLHSRGINCRYLGRLAQLANLEEAKDREAALSAQNADKSSSQIVLPRRSMPLCWLEMLECEMVARASKHVLDAYLSEDGGAASLHPALTVASFLSALVTTGEETAAETEARMEERKKAHQQNHSNGNASNNKHHQRKTKPILQVESPEDEEDMASLMLHNATEGTSGMGPRFCSRDEVWRAVEAEISRRFRYTLAIYNNGSRDTKSEGKASNTRAHFTPLLRRVCQRTGVRLAARNYQMGGKCVCAGWGKMMGNAAASYPVSPVDILDIVPTVKYAAAGDLSSVPSSFEGAATSGSLAGPSIHILLPDAKNALEAAHVYWSAGALSKALDLAHEASSLYQRVADTPLHASVVRCLDLNSIILFQAKQYDMAAANAAKSLGITVQLSGFDSAESVAAHSTLAHIISNCGDTAGAFKHLRAAVYLMELMAGPNYAELSSVYHKLGSMYYENGLGIGALRFYQEAASKKFYDRMMECMNAKSTAVVLAALGQYKAALESERRAYGTYRRFLGDEHEATKSSANSVKQFTKLAVEQGTRMAAEEKKRREEAAANAIASEIEAAETEGIGDKKKAKKKVSKKKKKT